MLSDCFFPVVASKSAIKEIGSSSKKNVFKSVVGLVKGNGILGSAYVEMGNSKITCSVLGPRLGATNSAQNCNLEMGTFECDVKFSSFLADNAINGLIRENQESVEKRLGEAIKNALESSILLHLYPKSIITIHAVVLQSSSCDAVSLINCASLALADASIELKDIVSAYSLICEQPTTPITSAEQFEALLATTQSSEVNTAFQSNQMVLNLAAMTSNDLTTYLEYSGRVAPDLLLHMVQRGKAGCAAIQNAMKDTLRRKIAITMQ